MEHLLINRDDTSDNYVYALKEDLEFIQKERDELMEQVEELEETISNLEDVEPAETEHQDLLQRIEELENQVSELEEENEFLQTYEEEDTDSNVSEEEVASEEGIQALLDEKETEKAALESENETLKQQINQLQMVEEQPRPNFDMDSLHFLQEKHPKLSKEAIIKTALDCSATNEEKGWYQTVYSFTDYVERGKSFINYQNSLS